MIGTPKTLPLSGGLWQVEIYRQVRISLRLTFEMPEHPTHTLDRTVDIVGIHGVETVDFYLARCVYYLIVAHRHAYMVDVSSLWVGEKNQVATLDV